MTTQDKNIYDFIVNYAVNNNILPTIREICTGTGLSSTSSVAAHLANLQKEGYIEKLTDTKIAYKVRGLKYVYEEPALKEETPPGAERYSSDSLDLISEQQPFKSI